MTPRPEAARGRTLRRCLLLLLLAVPAQAQRPAPPPWTLQTLMASLRQVRSSTADFTETRYLHLLNQAQRSAGRLLYVAPAWMQKQTTAPVASRLTINGDRLTIERLGQPNREISLQEQPQLGALVDSVRATLAGDLPALTRNFTPTLNGDASGWTLTLTPIDPKLHDMVASIRFLGQQTAIREVDTLEADGDRTVLAVTPTSK
jgi:outer membrane lipoprotein-sorting protein